MAARHSSAGPRSLTRQRDPSFLRSAPSVVAVEIVRTSRRKRVEGLNPPATRFGAYFTSSYSAAATPASILAAA